ncbi:MAG: RNA polymerase sigma factor [Woeseiaceae bacterium]
MVADAQTLTADGFELSAPSGLAYAAKMDGMPDDGALMLLYGDGDVAAFETLYRRHNDALYRYLLRLSRSPDAAEDIFQEVWSKIIRARQTYRPTAQFKTFLYRVARNCFIDYIRRNRRHEQTVELAPEHQPDPGELPDALTERSLARRRLAAALLELPDEQRDVFLLREEGGFSLEQIASITDSNRETVKSRLRYAVNKLRAAIDDPVEVS